MFQLICSAKWSFFVRSRKTTKRRATCEKYVEHIRDLIHVVKTSFQSTVCIKVPAMTSFPHINSKIIKNVFRKIETKCWFIVFINMKLMLAESLKKYLIYVQIDIFGLWPFPIMFWAVNVYSNNFIHRNLIRNVNEVQSWEHKFGFL